MKAHQFFFNLGARWRWVVKAGTHCLGGWVGPRAGLDEFEKSLPYWDSIPGLLSLYRVAIPTALSRPTNSSANNSHAETVKYLMNKNYSILILINIKNCTY
jgi:hypothetical protein